ncbi:MAG: S8 family serine peptidase [Deltaproteobacteria bacterium]|nr:S8 family serine peptidase [Deltaproteobacteria bacterium]
MKKLTMLLLLLLILQISDPGAAKTNSASTNLPIGVNGILPAHRISAIAPQPNIEQRHLQWQFHNPKLDSQLNYKLGKALLENLEILRSPIESVPSRKSGLTGTICVQVICEAKHHKTIENRIRELNGTVTGHNLNQTTIQMLIPLGSLNNLTEIPEIYFVRTPSRAVAYSGSFVTEALDDINADNWHGAGIYGEGTRIGVIDVGFLGYSDLQGSDLPATVTARNFVDGETSAQINSGSKHGTACAEIVYDLAPAAAIYLAKISTEIDLQEAVDWLRTTCNIDIISTSLGWYNLTPGDGTGVLADMATSAYNDGILWVTAAGNDQQRHWGGNFYDPEGDGIHNFNGEQNINYFGDGSGGAYQLEPGFTFTVYARWSDWQDVDQDYDLYIYRNEGSGWEKIDFAYCNGGTNWQNGSSGQTPTEATEFTTYGSTAAYGFIIYWANKTPPPTRTVNFEIFVPNTPRLDEILTSRSLPNLADVAQVTTVSAIDVSTYIRPEYSSEGPTNGSGGSASGGLGKPDIAAYTNVSTASHGALGFSGTSAATPHVAGTAALILSENPDFSPVQLQYSLENQAFDIETPGFDHTTGWGRLHLDDQGLSSCDPPSYIDVPTSDGGGFFQINWGASTTSSTTYVLEEAMNNSFSSNLHIAYTGTERTANISNKINGIYYYRIKATQSQYNDSPWTTGSNGCVVSIDSPDSTTWNGYSAYWNSTSNWSNDTIPDSTTSVTIPSSPEGGNWPLVSGTPARAKELFLSGQLTISDGSLTIGN